MLVEAGPSAEFAAALEKGHIVHFARCPLPLPDAEEQEFLREGLAGYLRKKNVSYYPGAGELTGLRAPAGVAARARSVLAEHGQRVRSFLESAMPDFTRGWQPGTSSFRPVEEEGRGLSAHASNELVHIDAGAYGATHGDRILRFFVNLNPSRSRVWISKGSFEELWRKHAAEAGMPSGSLTPALPERAFSALGAAPPALRIRAALGVDGAQRRRLARLHPRAARAGGHVPGSAAQLQAARAVSFPLGRGGVTEPSSVLVLRFSAVGDVVLTAPAIDALKQAWPKTRIFYAVKERLAHLVAHNPNVSEVVALREGEGPLRYARRLRALQPSVVLDLHGKIRSIVLRALLPSVPRVVWHKRDFRDTLPVKLALRPYHSSMLFADRYHAAVEQLVGRKLPKGRLQYFLGPDDVTEADRVLRAAGLTPGAPLLGLSPGANWETKRWPAERFAGLARRAANDSGPMHMARALGVPTLAFFGSTDPTMFDFRGHQVLFAGVECAPCSFFGRRRCPRGHFRCMLDLTEERAWGSLRSLLTAGRLPLLSA